MNPQLHVIIVDDSADDAELIVRELTRGGYDVASVCVDTADALQRALADGGWQIVLCDFSLPRFSGEAALRLVKASGLDVPFIFVSGTIGEDVAVRAMKAGADDYVMKDSLARLVPAVARELRETGDRQRAEQGLRKQTRMNQALFNQAITSFVLVGRDYRIIQVNEAYASYYGKTPHDFRGRSLFDVQAADRGTETIKAILDEVVRTKAAQRFTSWPYVFAARPEPSQPEPSQSEHVQSEHVQAEPSKSELPQSEPSQSEPPQPEGRLTYWDAILQPLLDEQGEVEFLFFSGVDVTERRRAEEALRAYTARLLQQEAALIGLTRGKASEDHVLTSLQRITEVASRTLGVARVSIWHYNADRTTMRCLDQHELETNRHTSGTEMAVADYPRYVESLAQDDVIAANDVTEEPRFAELLEGYLTTMGVTSMMDASVLNNGVLAGVVCHKHIGPPRQWTLDERTFAVATANVVALVLEAWERREAEAALRASEQRFRQVTENIDEVFWLTDVSKQEMIYISPAYSRMWGRTCESLTADPHSWTDAIHPDDRERVREAAQTRQSAGTYDIEYRIVRPDGAERYVHDRAFPIRDADNQVYRIAGVAADITERRQLEEQLRQSQKMEAIGRLAGGVAHDFNNLLAVIQMQCSLLLTTPGDAATMQDGLQQIMAASERAAKLTQQLLTFSRRDVSEARDIDLADVTDGMSKLLRRVLGEDLALETRVAHALPLVHADPGMMEQVLMNLAVNARDAMPDGGRLLISLDVVEIGAGDVARRARAVAGRFVRLLVRDTGCGIPPQDISRIFEPFFTTKEAGKGTGLGLATVFGIVERHHGWIDVTSAVGDGTTFEIFLPALAAARPASPRKSPVPEILCGTESILLVEDDRAVRALARLSLEHCGYRVYEAESPVTALALWETLTAPVDLLLTDLVMPGGMSGRELAELLVERQPGLKVIYSSGYSSEIVRPELLKPGYGFLQKPYHLAQMAATIRRCLDER